MRNRGCSLLEKPMTRVAMRGLIVALSIAALSIVGVAAVGRAAPVAPVAQETRAYDIAELVSGPKDPGRAPSVGVAKDDAAKVERGKISGEVRRGEGVAREIRKQLESHDGEAPAASVEIKGKTLTVTGTGAEQAKVAELLKR